MVTRKEDSFNFMKTKRKIEPDAKLVENHNIYFQCGLYAGEMISNEEHEKNRKKLVLSYDWS